MKQAIITILVAIVSLHATAQRIGRGPLHSPDNPRNEWLLPGDTLYNIDRQGASAKIYQGRPQRLAMADTIAAPRPAIQPIYGTGMHQGLNLSVDLSAFATLGKGAPHRGGFGQTINAAYLAPLTRDGKLWGAGGIYLNNVTWGGDAYRGIGLYGMLGYSPNDKWDLYLYGQLSVAANHGSAYGRYATPYWGYRAYNTLPLSMYNGYGYTPPGANVVGIGARYHFSPSFWVQLNVQTEWGDRPYPYLPMPRPIDGWRRP